FANKRSDNAEKNWGCKFSHSCQASSGIGAKRTVGFQDSLRETVTQWVGKSRTRNRNALDQHPSDDHYESAQKPCAQFQAGLAAQMPRIPKEKTANDHSGKECIENPEDGPVAAE